ncbi:hypothetical protein KEM55_008348 [Ascosphaera atra]|nr:hypothetical protein KEM55_008348 [Ascosphaera atra]
MTTNVDHLEDEYSAARRSQFRFKSKHEKDRDHEHRHRKYRRRHHHRRHHRSRSPFPGGPPPLSPNAAFRESLFDALADDEGASYWEHVYGQPIHEYRRPSVENEKGELEQMDDEEYATFVRAKMWEKSHEGILEERERRRRAKKAMDEERARERNRQSDFDRMIEESLMRGKERRSRKRDDEEWKDAWARYVKSWENLSDLAKKPQGSENVDPQSSLRNLIFWPVKSGKRRDITNEAVEAFMRNAPASSADSSSGSSQRSDQFLSVLKAERVRWHPDKMQHRYGGLGMEEQVLQSVTEVFQIVDKLWTEQREKGARG